MKSQATDSINESFLS